MNRTDYLGTATYSPEDNKLRLYPSSRLSKEDYDRFKAHGFRWAPRQELFVAPMWTPQRADLLEETCGDIGDEDKSLVERQEERAERFEDYSEKRASDADRARAGVSAIADNIPFGQPILVGHHSEKRARKDAERIENGMRKAVKMWETSKYWTQRAAGALAHAKYKELPQVRARRIKTIEADKRKRERDKAEAERALARWLTPNLTRDQALRIAAASDCGYLRLPKKEGDRPDWNYSPTAYDGLSGNSPSIYAPRTVEEVVEAAKQSYPRQIAWAERWITHFDNRLLYERAMLAESGASHLLERRKLPPKLPLCNYRAAGGTISCPNIYHPRESITYEQVDMTSAQYAAINVDYKGTRVCENSHRIRTATLHNPSRLVAIFLVDSKVHEKPAAAISDETRFAPLLNRPSPRPIPAPDPKAEEFKALKETLRAGVKLVSAPQLFPTPAALAERMVQRADIRHGHEVLEPSAGTGVLLRAIRKATSHDPAVRLTAVEINQQLTDSLAWAQKVHYGDFLECNGNLGKFDRIVMNPPFVDAQDIDHIRHAYGLLKPGGRLVAICANGPRQQRDLIPWIESLGGTWEQLPADTFKDSGTGVNTALLCVDKEEFCLCAE